LDFNRYFTNDELDALLNEWAETYADILALGELGRSHEDRSIQLLTLTTKSTGSDLDKPAVWLDANIHATEIAGTTTALRIAWELLSKYGSDERITRLVDTTTFYIVPRDNPDGAAMAMAQPPRYIRSGTRPYPFVDKSEGIHQQDIDGDNRIVQMRVKDPNGDWKISTQNPAIMEKRGPDENGGEYYRILPEGLIEDYDGYLIRIARSHEGLDFNRNFPFEWKPESDQYGAGPYPTSEPEIRAMVDFITKHNNINVAVAYHTYSGVILRPYGTKSDDDLDTGDLWTYKRIAERAEKLTGYKTISVFHDFKYHPKEVIVGVFDDWIYDQLGAYAYTIELWDIVGKAGIADRKYIDWMRFHPHEDDVKIYEWAKANGPEDGYIDWHPFDHPQLGPVEIGGWNAFYTWRNPPHAFMGEEAERNVPFVLALAEMLPRLEIHTFEVSALEEGVFHINLVIENSGFFPTCTSGQGKKKKASRPVRAELELPEGAELLVGKRKNEIGDLEGRSNKVSAFGFGVSSTDNRARLEWVVRTAPGETARLKLLSERAGSIVKEFTFQNSPSAQNTE
jgi:murein tripeptide amidase MpaA